MKDNADIDAGAFAKLKIASKADYDKVGYVHCPALKNAKVHFTSEGFNHLRYSKKKERTLKMQEAKLKLIKKGKEVIENTTTIQEYTDGLENLRIKKYKKVVTESVMVQYWGFIAIIKGTRLKVVIRRVDDGKYMFWSTIPMWRSTKYDKYSVIDQSTGSLRDD